MKTCRPDPEGMAFVGVVAREIAEAGRSMRLPFVAVSADIGSPEAMVGPDGRPLAETTFRWIDPRLEYWKDRSFALRSPFVHAARYSAEPFYFEGGVMRTWRPARWLEGIEAAESARMHNIGAAIIAPAHLPGGIIGAVVWASPDETLAVGEVFAARAAELHALAHRLMGAYHEALGDYAIADPVRLTRREIQCLKWAAAGKTDGEISQIMDISAPTVRFHITNAARKLGVAGRSQAVRHAVALGYVGAGPNRPAALDALRPGAS